MKNIGFTLSVPKGAGSQSHSASKDVMSGLWKMVISKIIGKDILKKVKELNISAIKTIVLKMKMVKLRVQRMAGHLLQDVSVKKPASGLI